MRITAIMMRTNPTRKKGRYKEFLGIQTRTHSSYRGKFIIQDHQYSHALPQIVKPGIRLRKHM
jgi:hypothetical protein